MEIGNIQVTLASISEQTDLCSLHKRNLRHYCGGEIGVALRTWLTPDNDKNSVFLTVEAIYTDRGRLMLPVLLTYAVTAKFRLNGDLNPIPAVGECLYLPHHLLTLMLGTVIGAMRGMISLRTAGTSLAGQPLPLLNVADLAASLSRKTVPEQETA